MSKGRGVRLFNAIAEILRDADIEDPNAAFWSDGDIILGQSEKHIEALADIIESCGDTVRAVTGYYDPDLPEEECEGRYAGYYYISIN